MPTSTLYYATVLLTALLGLSLGVVAYSFRKLIGKYVKLKEEQDQLLSSGRQKAEAVEQEARRKSGQIIANAEAAAAKILEEAKVFSGQEKERMQALFKSVSDQEIKSFQEMFAASKSEISRALATVSKDIKAEAIGTVSELKGTLLGVVGEAVKRVESEFQSQKKARLAKLDKEIFEIIGKVTVKVLGKALTLEEHQKLVIESLEEAKKQKMF